MISGFLSLQFGASLAADTEGNCEYLKNVSVRVDSGWSSGWGLCGLLKAPNRKNVMQ